MFMGSRKRYSVAISKDQTINGNSPACVKIRLCKLAHYILGENDQGFLLSNAYLLSKMVSGYRSYIKELVKQAVETTDSALFFLSPPTPHP